MMMRELAGRRSVMNHNGNALKQVTSDVGNEQRVNHTLCQLTSHRTPNAHSRARDLSNAHAHVARPSALRKNAGPGLLEAWSTGAYRPTLIPRPIIASGVFCIEKSRLVVASQTWLKVACVRFGSRVQTFISETLNIVRRQSGERLLQRPADLDVHTLWSESSHTPTDIRRAWQPELAALVCLW